MGSLVVVQVTTHLSGAPHGFFRHYSLIEFGRGFPNVHLSDVATIESNAFSGAVTYK